MHYEIIANILVLSESVLRQAFDELVSECEEVCITKYGNSPVDFFHDEDARKFFEVERSIEETVFLFYFAEVEENFHFQITNKGISFGKPLNRNEINVNYPTEKIAKKSILFRKLIRPIITDSEIEMKLVKITKSEDEIILCSNFTNIQEIEELIFY